MAGTRRVEVRRKGARARFHVAEAPVERRQFLAQVHDFDFHLSTAGRAAPLFRRVHQRAANPCLLPGRIDRQHRVMSNSIMPIDEHGADDSTGLQRCDERSGSHPGMDFRRGGPIALLEKLFDFERGIDHVDERADVRRCRLTNDDRFGHPAIL